jgi:hypothetical protein
MDERAVERREVRWIVHGEAKQLTSAAVEGGAVTPLRAEPSWAPLVLPELVSADFKILLSDPQFASISGTSYPSPASTDTQLVHGFDQAWWVLSILCIAIEGLRDGMYQLCFQGTAPFEYCQMSPDPSSC